MDFTQFAWRDGVVIIAVGIGIYVAVLLLRLLQLGQRKGGGLDLGNHAPPLFAAAEPAPPAATTAYELPFDYPRPLAAADTAPGEGPDAAADAAVPAPRADSTAGGATFAQTLEASRLEQEVRQLRAEVAALREELLDLQATHRVAPQYADAMALARRGFDAHGIADHCGIALGEAELVMALARGATALQAENDYGVAGPSQDAMHPHGGSERSERGGMSYGVAGPSQDAMSPIWGQRTT